MGGAEVWESWGVRVVPAGARSRLDPPADLSEGQPRSDAGKSACLGE